MPSPLPAGIADLDPIESRRTEAALRLAEQLYLSADENKTPAERRLDAERGRMVKDLGGKQTLATLMDQAFRSRRNDVTARQFARILKENGVPHFFGPFERAGLAAFQHLAGAMPGILVPIVKAVMQEKTKEVILPGEQDQLLTHVRARRAEGVRLNVNHLGEMILGENEADEKTNDDVALLLTPEIDCISVKASNLYSQINALAHDHSVAKMAERLRPRLRAAMQSAPTGRDGKPEYKLVNLDMEEYRDLAITLDAFLSVVAEPEFLPLQVGLALQAYVPDSYAAAERVITAAKERLGFGGAPLRIRVVKGANMAMEHIDSSVRDLAVPTYEDKADTDANWKAMVELISRPENIVACNLGVASHNVFDMAWAATLVKERGVEAYVLYEMLEGMANHVQRAVQRSIGKVLLYAPAVPKEKFLTAIAYLMRRFDELTDPNNFLSHIFGIVPDTPEWNALAASFVESVRRMPTVSHARKRTQNRLTETHDGKPVASLEAFRNERDTDWTAAENRAWLKQTVLDRLGYLWQREPEFLRLGIVRRVDAKREVIEVRDRSNTDVVAAHVELAAMADLDSALDVATSDAAKAAWTNLLPQKREQILCEAAAGLARRRDDFLFYAAVNVGKTFDQTDAEVSEAVDFGRFYPLSARVLRDENPHLTFGPLGNGVVAVISPWNFPVAIPAGGVFAALAAGNRVILKPSPESLLVTSKIADAFWEAGVPREALQVLTCRNDVAAALVADLRVDGVIFTGSTATADRILESRPDLQLFAETGGKNCTIITDRADRELAIKHVADSFRNNGQKCSATSIVVVTPDIYDDPTFWSQLKDAVASLPVGSAWEPQSVVTPLFRTPGIELHRGLTRLEDGEEWVLQPQKVNNREDFWTPGIKKGTPKGSFSHVTELFGPVITVMQAATLDEALDIVHATGRGLTVGIETLDDAELKYVADRVRVGVIYGRRSTVGAIVHRQTFGGWADSRRGPGVHAGGLNYVTNFMTVADTRDAAGSPAFNDDFFPMQRDFFGQEHRPAQNVRGEDNVHRYRPIGNVVIRLSPNDSPETVRRMATAAVVAGNKVTVSFATEAAAVAAAARDMEKIGHLKHIVWREETDASLAQRIREDDVALLRYATRAAVPASIWAAVVAHARCYVETRPPLAAGRIELLRYLQEQTLSDSYHRYGGGLRKKDET